MEMDENSRDLVLSALAGALERSRPGEEVLWNRGKSKKIMVLCVPIGEILEVLGMRRIDFWSLDIEGSDLDVLKTFPWNKVDVEVIFQTSQT